MKDYNTYVFFLCLIVFLILTVLSVIMIKYIVNMSVRLIDCGEQDENLKIKYQDQTKKKRSGMIVYILNGLLCLIFVVAFAFSMCINTRTESVSQSVPTLRVVLSSSMASKYSGNKYLFENDVNDQFEMHDVLLTYKLPNEFDLKLYDVVVYEVEGTLIVHRIVEIEEPNVTHPNCRYFKMRGDAVQNADRFPVLYSQMRGIYRGERVRFVGSFVTFMRSFAGWLCTGLLVASAVFAPVLENYVEKKRKGRYELIAAENENAFEGETIAEDGNNEDA